MRFYKRMLSVFQVLNEGRGAIYPLPPISLKPLVRVMWKKKKKNPYKRCTFFYNSWYGDKMLYMHQRCQCSATTEAQAKRQPSQLSLVHLWKMSPYRWARLVHTAADHTFLSANTARVAYINSSSHPCIPTVQLPLAALLCRVFRRKVVCSELH